MPKKPANSPVARPKRHQPGEKDAGGIASVRRTAGSGAERRAAQH